MANDPLVSRAQFISAEINHDFCKARPLLDAYQPDCWNLNTICSSHDITINARRAGDTGDDDLVKQVLGLTKEELKQLPAGVEYDLTNARVCSPDVKLNVDLFNPANGDAATQQAELEKALRTDPVVTGTCNIVKIEVPSIPHPIESHDREIYKVFRYPDENFLIIDAIPNFVTGILKQIRFPSVPDCITGEAEEPGKIAIDEDELSLGATSEGAMFDPQFFSNHTQDELDQLTAFGANPPNKAIYWPFRPKINIINTPATIADPGKSTSKPGNINYNIDKMISKHTLKSDTSYIPGLPVSEIQAVPLIYSWYYNRTEVSQSNNALMMTTYKITTELYGGPNQIGPQKLIMNQTWDAATVGPGAKQEPPFSPQPASSASISCQGKCIHDPNSANEPRQSLKPQMISHNPPLLIDPQPPTPQTPAMKQIRGGQPVNQEGQPIGPFYTDEEAKRLASWLVQRKRGGDYLQIKSAYEFPPEAKKSAQAAITIDPDGDEAMVYKLYQGPFYAMYTGSAGNPTSNLNEKTRIYNGGHLKNNNIPVGVSTKLKTRKWYRNRTYVVTGDWPAFCYASFNRINCILVCQGGNGGCNKGGKTLIFRNFFN